jgi:murein DD-endopeptidase
MAPMRTLLLLSTLATVTLATGCAFAPSAENESEAAARAAAVALEMVGKPYHYGGNTPGGFDCSGLVQYSYGRAGVNLPHGTNGLLRKTRVISWRELQPGDLLFFDQLGKKASHVGIYVGNDEFVHAPSSGKVVNIAPFSDRYWKKHFAQARRVDAF